MGSEGWADKVKVHGIMVLVGAGYGGYNVLTKVSLSGGVDPSSSRRTEMELAALPCFYLHSALKGFTFLHWTSGSKCESIHWTDKTKDNMEISLHIEVDNQVDSGLNCDFLVDDVVDGRQHWRKMSVEVAGLILALAFLGVYLQQTFYLYGLRLTNVVFAALVMNCIPVWAFVIAAVFGIEEVAFYRRDGQAKVLGILFCVSGTTILTLYKGPVVFGDSPPLPGTTVSLGAFLSVLQGWEIEQWRLGALYLIMNSFLSGVFVNLQVPALKRFPAPFTLTSISAFLGCIMLATTAFFRVRSEPSKWILPPGPDLIAVIYAGLVASGFCLSLQFWSNHKNGPVFVAAYTPMQPIFSTFFGILFLGDALYLGSILGATAIVSGLFLVLWGIQENLRVATLSLQVPTHAKYPVDAAQPTSLLVEPLLP